jgi:hypothetical protein
VPAGDGDEGHRGGVVAHLLDEPGHLLRDLLKPKENICAKDLATTTIEKKLSKAFKRKDWLPMKPNTNQKLEMFFEAQSFTSRS